MTDALLVILCILVVSQSIWKYFIHVRESAILRRVEVLLNVTETHSRLNQENKEQLKATLEKMKADTTVAARRAESVAKEATNEVKSAVKEVPKEVVKEIHESRIIDLTSESSTKLTPTPKPQN